LFNKDKYISVRRDSVVGNESVRVGRSGIRIPWGWNTPRPSRPAMEFNQPPGQCVSGLFPAG